MNDKVAKPRYVYFDFNIAQEPRSVLDHLKNILIDKYDLPKESFRDTASNLMSRIVGLQENKTEGFEVMLGGDCELETMIRALKFITKVLEDESEEVYD